jgi:cobalamin synthase
MPRNLDITGLEQRSSGRLITMTTSAGSGSSHEKNVGRQRAAGICAIVTAAILTAAGAQLSTTALAVAVVVTLVVYWSAEEYAELLGEHVEAGDCPGSGRSGPN